MEEEEKNNSLWGKMEGKWLRIKSSWEKYATIILGGFGLLLFAAAMSMPFLVYNYFVSDKMSLEVTSQDKSEQNISSEVNIFEGLGPVGDFIGGTTVAFLTAASTVFLLATIIMQRKEIKIGQQNIKELVIQTEATVQQAEEARKETQITNQTMKKQQFEATFFNMLQLHHQIVNDIQISVHHEVAKSKEIVKKTYDGRAAFVKLKEILEAKLAKEYYLCQNNQHNEDTWERLADQAEWKQRLLTNPKGINQKILNLAYGDFHKDFGNAIGHYMRNNYRIVKFIVENVVDNEEESKQDKIVGDKRFYFGTLRAQWSNAEFELIFINSLYGKNKKFKNLIKKYDVLDIQETDEEELEDKPEGSFILKNDTPIPVAYNHLIEKDSDDEKGS